MSWSRLLAALLLTGPFLATIVLAEKGDYILGAGISVDDENGFAAIVVADLSVAEQTWLSASIGRNSVELPNLEDLDTWLGEVSVDLLAAEVNSVFLDAGIGETELRVPDGWVRDERSFLVGSESSWRNGLGEARINIDVGVGEVVVRLDG